MQTSQDELKGAHTYSWNLSTAATKLLDLLREVATTAELHYLDGKAREIVGQTCVYETLREVPSASQQKMDEALGKLTRLKQEATQFLTKAGVSRERQKLLEELVAAENIAFSMQGVGVGDVKQHIIELFENGTLQRFKETADLLKAPQSHRDFFNRHLRLGRALVAEKNKKTEVAQ